MRTFSAGQRRHASRARPADALRHSFASYYLAKHKDAARTALELGHGNQDMLFRNYREMVKPAEAEKFWEIVP